MTQNFFGQHFILQMDNDGKILLLWGFHCQKVKCSLLAKLLTQTDAPLCIWFTY